MGKSFPATGLAKEGFPNGEITLPFPRDSGRFFHPFLFARRAARARAPCAARIGRVPRKCWDSVFSSTIAVQRMCHGVGPFLGIRSFEA